MKFPRQSKIQKSLVFGNQKEGVGKTTICLQTGFFVAENDKKVLIVDMDGQGNITNALLDGDLTAIKGSLTCYHLFQGKTDDNLKPIEIYDNLSLIASTDELHDVEAMPLECVENPNQWLQQFHNDFDYILFDTPPSLRRRLMGGVIRRYSCRRSPSTVSIIFRWPKRVNEYRSNCTAPFQSRA